MVRNRRTSGSVELPRQRVTYSNLCCGTVNYTQAALIVGVLESLYWFYNCVLFLFSIINHGRLWSIIVTGIYLLTTVVQIAFLFYGILRDRPLFVQLHLMYLVLDCVFKFLMIFGMLALAIAPYPKVNFYFAYDGMETNARVFAIVMFVILVLLIIIRCFFIVVIYRFWKLQKARLYREKQRLSQATTLV